jgi:transcriptional regulator with XRE-family HTH domain
MEKGLKQSWLAKKINKSPSEVNRWVKGRTIPVFANMNKIAKALNISIEEIFYYEVIEGTNSKIDRRVSRIIDRRGNNFLEKRIYEKP